MKLKALMGSGDKIIFATLPFLAVGLALNLRRPSLFEVGGPSPVLRAVSVVMLAAGVAIWLWSIALVLTKAARNELITNGPFALVKHPIYTAVALLALPAAGFLLNSWLGVAVGIVMYVWSRVFSPREEAHLARTFGAAWDEYLGKVKLPWL